MKIIETKIGKLTVVGEHGAVTEIRYARESASRAAQAETETEILASSELLEYFDGKRQSFSFKITPAGSEFERLVWAELQKIPYGETRTYGDIAKAVKHEKAARAVGNACRKNPILIAVPCHRAVGKSGIGGFVLGGDAKRLLLEIENRNRNKKISQ